MAHEVLEIGKMGGFAGVLQACQTTLSFCHPALFRQQTANPLWCFKHTPPKPQKAGRTLNLARKYPRKVQAGQTRRVGWPFSKSRAASLFHVKFGTEQLTTVWLRSYQTSWFKVFDRSVGVVIRPSQAGLSCSKPPAVSARMNSSRASFTNLPCSRPWIAGVPIGSDRGTTVLPNFLVLKAAGCKCAHQV